MPIYAKALKLFCYIPEAIVVGLACLTFVGIRPAMKKMTLFGVIYGCTIFLCRDLIVPFFGWAFGIHTVMLVILNMIFLKILFSLNIAVALICAFLYFTILFLIEPLTLILFNFMGIPTSKILGSALNSFLCNCCTLAFVSAIIYLLRKKNYTLLPIAKMIR